MFTTSQTLIRELKPGDQVDINYKFYTVESVVDVTEAYNITFRCGTTMEFNGYNATLQKVIWS